MTKLRVGIIGAGTIGNVHVARYAKNPKVELVGAVDPMFEKAHDMGSRYGMPAYSSSADMYEAGPVDAVSVCTPNDRHNPETLIALSNKAHVLCEKPMALNAKEARAMRDASKRHRRILMMAMVSRYWPGAQALKRMIGQGEFGRIYHVNIQILRRRGIPGMGGWFTTKARSGGGPLIDLGVHLLDLAMHLTGFPKPLTVSASAYTEFGRNMKKYNYVNMWAGPPNFRGTFDVEDFVSAFYRFAGNMSLSLECAWASNMEVEDTMSTMLFGDKMGCRFNMGGTPTLFGEHAGLITDFAPKLPEGDKFQTEIDHFVDCVQTGKPPESPADQGVALMELLDATYASAANGREVKLK